MSETLPQGWFETKIKACVEIKYGKGLVKENRQQGNINVYGSNGVVGCHNNGITKGITIIIGRKGSVGRIHLCADTCWPIDTTYYIDEFHGINEYFLYRFLQTIDLAGLESSSAIPGINREIIYDQNITLPPLNEQKRIIAKLDVIIPRIDSVKARLEKVPMIIKRFRQSVLTAAVTGKLTGCNNEYPNAIFDNLIISIRGGTTVPPGKEKTKYPVLRSSSVRQGSINFEDVFYLKAEESTKRANFIQNGDILFTRLNGSAEFVGNCAVVKHIESNIYQYPDRLYCAKLTRDILPSYCEIAFSTPTLRLEIENRAKSSAGHKRISISDIREIIIPLPPLEEQKKIVRQVDRLFALAYKLEAHYHKAKTRIDKLSQSILTKTFHGELVPQDPNDEPAEKLLERIMEEKAKMEGGGWQKAKRIKRRTKV